MATNESWNGGNMPKTAIVICHFTGDIIKRCIKTLPKDTDNIVITSNENFTEDIRNLYTEVNEPTFKRNIGTDLTESDYIVFMDDDVELEPNCIKEMEEYLDSNKEIGMIYATLYKMDNHSKLDTSGSYLSWCGFLNETYETHFRPVSVLASKSALCMIKRDVFEKVGKFDEDFVIYGEETDLSWRVWLAGYQVKVLPRAIGYHAFETPLKPKSYYNTYYIHYHGCKNYLTMLVKNLPAHLLYIAFLNACIWFITACVMFFKNKTASKWILEGIWYNVKEFSYIWQKRKRVIRTTPNIFRYIYRNPPLVYYFRRLKDYFVHELHG